MILLSAGAGIGVLFAIIGGAFYISGRRKHKKVMQLLQESTVDLGIDLSTAIEELARVTSAKDMDKLDGKGPSDNA